jgi:AcrR family transcriptional regulator
MSRKYELKERAERLAETRRRIVEAANELHRTVGFVDATISAVAEHAGVQRLTVYRHFATERDLVGACATHFFTAHPVPELEPWSEISDPEARLGIALQELYEWFGTVDGNMANFLRDAPAKPFLYELGQPLFEYFAEVRRVLGVGWRVGRQRRRLVLAAIGHAVAFPTWQSLVRQEGLRRDEAVALAVAAVRAAAGRYPPS